MSVWLLNVKRNPLSIVRKIANYARPMAVGSHDREDRTHNTSRHSSHVGKYLYLHATDCLSMEYIRRLRFNNNFHCCKQCSVHVCQQHPKRNFSKFAYTRSSLDLVQVHFTITFFPKNQLQALLITAGRCN